MSTPFAAIYLLVLAALVATSIFYAHKRSKAGRPLTVFEWLWTAPSALALVFLGVWSARGLVDVQKSVLAVPLTALVIGICGAYALRHGMRPKTKEFASYCGFFLLHSSLYLPLLPLRSPLTSSYSRAEQVIFGSRCYLWACCS